MKTAGLSRFSRPIVHSLYLLGAFLCLMGPLSATPVYYLSTDQTGAQTQIDVNHTSSWIMTPTVEFDFGGGLFTMKAGSNPTATVMFSLYEGTNAGGVLLTSVVLTSTQFCAQVSNCGTFAFHQFFFTTPVLLAPGTNYFVALTSLADDVQSKAYFIKNNVFFISDVNGNPITPPPVLFNNPVPEPRSLETAGFGLLLILSGAVLARARKFPRSLPRNSRNV